MKVQGGLNICEHVFYCVRYISLCKTQSKPPTYIKYILKKQQNYIHLTSITFMQPSVCGPKVGERQRGVQDYTQLACHVIPNTIDLCRLPHGRLQPRFVSARLNLTHTAIHLFPQGHNVSHLPSHLQLKLLPKLPIRAKVHSRGCRIQINAPNSSLQTGAVNQ